MGLTCHILQGFAQKSGKRSLGMQALQALFFEFPRAGTQRSSRPEKKMETGKMPVLRLFIPEHHYYGLLGSFHDIRVFS